MAAACVAPSLAFLLVDWVRGGPLLEATVQSEAESIDVIQLQGGPGRTRLSSLAIRREKGCDQV